MCHKPWLVAFGFMQVYDPNDMEIFILVVD